MGPIAAAVGGQGPGEAALAGSQPEASFGSPRQRQILLEAGPEGGLAVVRLSDCQAPDTLEWVGRVLRAPSFAWLQRDLGATTASVILAEASLVGLPPPAKSDVDRGWAALCLRPGKSSDAAVQPGPLAELRALVEAAGVAARTLLAGGPGYLLIRQVNLSAAILALVKAGHAVCPGPTALAMCPAPLPPAPQSTVEEARQHVGVWSLLRREQPLGTLVEEHAEGDGPLRIQCPGGLYIEARIPQNSGGVVQHASCGGRHILMEVESLVLSLRQSIVGFQPCSVERVQRKARFNEGQLTMGEVTHPLRQGGGDGCVEAWARLNRTAIEFVALELLPEKEESLRRAGLWLFAGKHFVRITGLARGHGLVAGACCRSLTDLERVQGAGPVRAELRAHYDVVQGTVKAPGLLLARRRAWPAATAAAEQVLFDAAASVGGAIDVAKGIVQHTLPDGSRQRWRIVEWDFDPFTPASKTGQAAGKPGSKAAAVKEASKSASEESSDSSGAESSSPSHPQVLKKASAVASGRRKADTGSKKAPRAAAARSSSSRQSSSDSAASSAIKRPGHPVAAARERPQKSRSPLRRPADRGERRGSNPGRREHW